MLKPLLPLLGIVLSVTAADRNWQLLAKHDAAVRQDGQGAVHVETHNEEATARISREMQVPEATREIHVQVDWRPHDGSKAANIFTLSSWDVNQALVKIRTAPGRNRLVYSTGGVKFGETSKSYQVGHWHRIMVRVTQGVYHLAVIDRGPENLRDLRVLFDSRHELENPPGLMNTERPLRRFFASAYPNQGKRGYSFELANFNYRLK